MLKAVSAYARSISRRSTKSYIEQRIVPTGIAARDNEVKQRRDLSESIFREWLPADAVRDGELPQCMLPGSGRHENGTNLIFSDCQEDAVFNAALSSDTGKLYGQESFSV